MKVLVSYLIFIMAAISAIAQVNMCKKVLSGEELLYIKFNAKQVIQTNPDTCVLRSLKYLTESYVKTSRPIYIETLDCIQWVSDGYLSEYFWYLGKELINGNFNGFFSYVYENRSSRKTNVRSWFIESASVILNAEEKNERESKRKELKHMMLHEASKYSYNKDKIKYLKQLVKQFNPNI